MKTVYLICHPADLNARVGMQYVPRAGDRLWHAKPGENARLYVVSSVTWDLTDGTVLLELEEVED